MKYDCENGSPELRCKLSTQTRFVVSLLLSVAACLPLCFVRFYGPPYSMVNKFDDDNNNDYDNNNNNYYYNYYY